MGNGECRAVIRSVYLKRRAIKPVETGWTRPQGIATLTGPTRAGLRPASGGERPLKRPKASGL